ncbi:MAG TPA: efflux RND transporter periplasmic adaptor subunit [Streptosporangiaceae bacterium]|nr:efflux RND transporter periplasmic adaptor subunit [Streptosporangiaceae bacterium]
MSGTVSRRRESGPQAEAQAAVEVRRPRGRGRWVALGIVVAVAAGAASAWRVGVLAPAASSGAAQGSPPPATAAVMRQDLSATTPVTATLGYADSYAVTGHGATLTWLPSPGRVVRQGQVLYKTDDGNPVVLLYGRVPAWRILDDGVTGQDVTQLNHDLVALGDADSAEVSALGWDYYSWQTQAGVEKLQSALGISYPSGSMSLGQLVFEPEAIRVSQVTGSLGGPASGPVLAATSDRHVVTIPLDASQQSEVKTGDPVTVTLPDGTTTPGVVSAVGTVATTSGSGQNATTTIPVYVSLVRPSAAGTLDQAPVTVNITTATARNALVVPVGALLARTPGGYDVEVVGPGNMRRYVPVTTGIFDDTDGLAQVTGALTPGQRVVVPGT